MLSKSELKELLLLACNTGADFAELYFENTYENRISVENDIVLDVTKSNSHGVGVRLLKDQDETYGSSNDSSFEGVKKLINELKAFYNSNVVVTDLEFKDENRRNILHFTDNNSDNLELKISYLKRMTKASNDYSKEIIKTSASFTEHTQEVLIVNTLGKYVSDLRNQTRFSVSAISQRGADKQGGSAMYGGNYKLERYKDYDFEALGIEAATTAVTMLDAVDVKGGIYDVVINNGFGGVIFHEACGHGLEATSVAKGLSVFANKIGEQIAATCVTAIDDGTIENEWGSLNYDDEGNETKRNVLIENGILKSYMVDYKNSKIMNHQITGSGRRQSYRFSPTSRMTNTYIENGPYEFEDLIKNTKYGIFAKKLGGGSVDPSTGEFNFGCDEAYLIEDGKITKPLKGVTLIGNGAQTIMNIDMVANNRTLSYGMCGSLSGSIHACVGQPTIRVRNMTVGGNGGN